MIRRRRRPPPRETVFSFDSFLDLVTNVVGIIIRLILVAWIGARSYSSVVHSIKPDASPQQQSAFPPVTDPLQQELERQQAELAQAQERLLEQLRQLKLAQATHRQAEQQLAALDAQRQQLDQLRSETEQQVRLRGGALQELALSLSELEKRRQRLTEELKELEKQPGKKVLRYRTPVSQVVHGEEYHFECRAGKVTYINLAELLPQVRRGLRDKEEQLKTQWEVADVTEPVGAFRLRYVIERRRDVVEAALGSDTPDPYSNFGYGLSSWQVEAITQERGETVANALAAGSEFRRVVAALCPQETSITFWVYPDSFAIYRQLRDYLVDLGFTVAGRPLPEGTPIAASRRGTHSRGQ